MTLPNAWMRQAISDFRIAQRIDNDRSPRTRCQAISKYQQSVEKSIKAVLDKLHAVGLIRSSSDRRHAVARYAAVLSGFPADTKDRRNLLYTLRRLFTPSIIDQIQLLDSLVPEYPAPDTLARRNHEYPFQDTNGEWHAPADEDVFSAGEMKRIRNCAGTLVPRLAKILEALDLLYPRFSR